MILQFRKGIDEKVHIPVEKFRFGEELDIFFLGEIVEESVEEGLPIFTDLRAEAHQVDDEVLQ